MFAQQAFLEPLLDEPLAYPLDRRPAAVERRDNLAVPPDLARPGDVGFQQYPRLQQQLLRMPALADQIVKVLPLPGA